MVERKGAGYSLEAVVAVGTIFIFVLGGLTIPDNQNWGEFRTQVSSDDLTYALQSSGQLNHALSEGEVGSIQTAISTISERNVEVSGLISNLPIAENQVAFYTLPEDRFTQQLDEIESGDTCDGDLEEISSRSEEPVLRTEGGALADSVHTNETLYLGDLDPNEVGGNNERDYDSVWVDRGKECQFAADEGPHHLDEIIRWEDENYDIENIDGGDRELTLYRATQAVRIREVLREPVNGVETFVNIDAVDFSEIASNNYNVLILPERKTLDYIDSGSDNLTRVTNFMEDGSALVLADPNSTHFDDGDFLNQTGFRYPNVSYSEGYSGGEISGSFTQTSSSQDTNTYFVGLRGENNQVSLAPPGTVSDRESTIQASESLLISEEETFNFSEWNRINTSMQPVDPSDISGTPESQCYFDQNGDRRDSALTQGKMEFPDGETYSFLSAELGTSNSFCRNNNERGIVVDTADNGYPDDPTLLNDQLVEVANRQYAVRPNSSTGCSPGQCLEFNFQGSQNVELVSNRRSFPGFDGDTMALMNYEESYSAEDRKMVSSVIHWLRGDQLDFVGLSPPEGISTSTYSGIQNETYLPYRITMRWSN